jgi:hypothetical protein
MTNLKSQTSRYYIFPDNNKYLKSRFSIEQAEYAYKTLRSCFDCVNCVCCYNCYKCNNLVNADNLRRTSNN